MFRGANIDWVFRGKVMDLPPAEDNNQILFTTTGETILRQDEKIINNLKSSFFNNNDLVFTSSNYDYWAMSADITKNVLLFGYSFGIFLPIGEKNRFLKTSYGVGIGFYEYYVYLNLCEKYILNEISSESKNNKKYYEGKCIGKVNIDESLLKGSYTSTFQSSIFWERISDNSIFSLLKIETSQGFGSGTSNLKKHNKKITTNALFDRIEFFSYTYRF